MLPKGSQSKLALSKLPGTNVPKKTSEQCHGGLRVKRVAEINDNLPDVKVGAPKRAEKFTEEVKITASISKRRRTHSSNSDVEFIVVNSTGPDSDADESNTDEAVTMAFYLQDEPLDIKSEVEYDAGADDESNTDEAVTMAFYLQDEPLDIKSEVEYETEKARPQPDTLSSHTNGVAKPIEATAVIKEEEEESDVISTSHELPKVEPQWNRKGKYDRATHEQLQHYIDFCRNRPELLAGKNNPKTPRQMQELWAELAAGLNSLRGPTRTTAKWKVTLGVWKSQLRTRARRIKSSLLVTGGGPCTKSLSDFEELALSTLGAAAVHGIGRNTLGVTLPSRATTQSESAPSSQYGLGRGNSLQLDDITDQCDETLELANGNVSVVGSAVSPEEFSVSSASVSSHSPAVPSSAEIQLPSTSQNSNSAAYADTRSPKSGKLQEVLWEKIKKKEVEEKLRDEQNRKIVEILQTLANSVSELTQEIKNMKK